MSNPDDLQIVRWWLDYLKTLGVTITIEGDEARVKAPPGVLTEGRLRDLRTYKAEVIEILASEAT